MRSIDSTLTSALQAGTGIPYLRGTIGYTNGTVVHDDVVYRYKLTGSTLEFEMPYTGDVGGDQTCIWLQRGLTIAGVHHTLTTGRFRILSPHYTPDGRQVAQGALFPRQYYSAAGDDTYRNVISAFCTAFGKTAVFRDPAAAWLDYQFLPAGKSIILNDANKFANLLAQKYLIFFCDNGDEEVLFYSCAGSLNIAPDLVLSPVNDFTRDRSQRTSRCLIWRDENEAVHTAGSVTDPLHNLGFLPSTASAPARHSAPNLFEARLRPDLRVVDGDVVQVEAFGGASNGFALVTEEFNVGAKHASPKWETIIASNEVFGNTEGGALPSTIERVSNYTPLNTGSFNRFLSSSDNNLQAAMDTIDDQALASYSAFWGCNGLLGTVGAGATMYMAPFADGLFPSGNIRAPFCRAGTAKNMSIRIETAQPASGTLVITLVVAGAATAVVITIPAGSVAGVYSDTTHTAAVAATQGIAFQIKNNAASGSAQINGLSIEIAGLS